MDSPTRALIAQGWRQPARCRLTYINVNKTYFHLHFNVYCGTCECEDQDSCGRFSKRSGSETARFQANSSEGVSNTQLFPLSEMASLQRIARAVRSPVAAVLPAHPVRCLSALNAGNTKYGAGLPLILACPEVLVE